MSPERLEKFWSYVEKTDTCWNWIKADNGAGYGIFSHEKNKIDRAHRIAYRETYGEIPKGMFVCHHCDNRKCVRPDHLFVGTNQDNVNDMMSKKRNSPPPPMAGWNRQTISEKGMALLGKISDREIARMENVTRYVVARIRRNKGIKAKPSETKFRKGSPHPRWSRGKGVQH